MCGRVRLISHRTAGSGASVVGGDRGGLRGEADEMADVVVADEAPVVVLDQLDLGDRGVERVDLERTGATAPSTPAAGPRRRRRRGRRPRSSDPCTCRSCAGSSARPGTGTPQSFPHPESWCRTGHPPTSRRRTWRCSRRSSSRRNRAPGRARRSQPPRRSVRSPNAGAMISAVSRALEYWLEINTSASISSPTVQPVA